MLTRLSVIFAFLLAFFSPLQAQTATPAASDVSPIKVAGRRLFDVGPTTTSTAVQRATRVNRRLQNLVEQDEELTAFSPDSVTSDNGEQVINIGNTRVLTVTQRDAEDAGQEVRELALVRGASLSRAVRDARATRENPLQGAGILIGNSLTDVVNSFLKWLPRVFAAILLIAFFWVVAKFARKMTRRGTTRFHSDPNLRDLLTALSFYGVWFIGLLSILSVLGFDSGSLATAVGVSGFALGFAFKDILAHFLAGILLLVGGKFRIGDQIVFKEYEGTVERIELRALELRTYDNRLVIIPNADVFSSAIISNTASPHRRQSFTVPIDVNFDLARAQRLVLEAVEKTSGVQEVPPPDVVIEEITKETVTLRARFHTNSLRSDYVHVGSECMKNVTIALANARAQDKAQEAAASSGSPS